jgi:long-subunit acyl-CoA synthetase (AMP-forming)
LPGYFSTAQLSHAVADAGIDSLLTDDPVRIRMSLPGFGQCATSLESGLVLMQNMDGIRRGRSAQLPPHTAKITYTSGSTGTPQGVCLSKSHIDEVAESVATALAPLAIKRHLTLLPLATLLENVAGLYAALRIGATCELPGKRRSGMDYGGVDAASMLATISQCTPESLILVPELLRLLLVAIERGAWTPPASLKFIAVGGASVSRALLERASAVELPVYEGYGLSECGSVVSLNLPGSQRGGSVGRPLSHVRVRVDAGGQIHVRGAVMLGHLGGSGMTGGEIATGDLGAIDQDGFLYIRGRRRNLFITSLGRNISPEWIESELSQEAGIAHACVFGEAQPYVIALISPLPGRVTADEIQRSVDAANARLPDYAQVRRWTLVPDGFSSANGTLTANGRLRRECIAERHHELIDSLYEIAIAS